MPENRLFKVHVDNVPFWPIADIGLVQEFPLLALFISIIIEILN